MGLAEATFDELLRLRGLPEPTKEYHFHDTRRWRFDYAWPKFKVALEVEGGVWKRGRHNRAKGFLGDIEKYNAAVMLGWKLLRVETKALATQSTIVMIETLIKRAIRDQQSA